jgi:hypothetical protein
VITETMTAIPTCVDAPDREVAEAELARHARSFNSMSPHKIGERILRTSIRTVHNPATSLNRSRQRGSCGCGTVATADSVWTDTSKLRRCRVPVVDRTTRRTATRR